jgi:two-component system NtrC family sensor kinase
MPVLLPLVGLIVACAVLGFALRAARRTAADLERRLGDERRQHDDRARSARLAAVDTLAAGVAHEINNPLTGVLGYADLLLAEMPADAPQRADIEIIKTEALRARRIVRGLLDFARPQPPDMEAVDLCGLVRGCVDMVRHGAERRAIRIVESYTTLLPQLLDPAAVQQVLRNVLDNAQAAMPDGGTLRVAVSRVDVDAVIRIEDDGVGMDAQTRDRAFHPFFTLGGGQGLGLSVALGHVEANGGSIDLTSRSDEGTVVAIRLPIMTAAVVAAQPAMAGRATPADLSAA